MRLIDADELKKAFIDEWNYEADYAIFRQVENIIDNATTVEPDKELKEKVETYKTAYRIMSDAFEGEVRKNKRSYALRKWGIGPPQNELLGRGIIRAPSRLF